LTNVGVYFSSAVEGSKTYMALGLTGKSSTTEQTIASNITVPTGSLIWTRPLFSYTALSVGTLTAGQFQHIWLKRVTPANAYGSLMDYVILSSTDR
jgi:hypothetical protein